MGTLCYEIHIHPGCQACGNDHRHWNYGWRVWLLPLRVLSLLGEEQTGLCALRQRRIHCKWDLYMPAEQQQGTVSWESVYIYMVERFCRLKTRRICQQSLVPAKLTASSFWMHCVGQGIVTSSSIANLGLQVESCLNYSACTHVCSSRGVLHYQETIHYSKAFMVIVNVQLYTLHSCPMLSLRIFTHYILVL